MQVYDNWNADQSEDCERKVMRRAGINQSDISTKTPRPVSEIKSVSQLKQVKSKS